LTTHDSRLTIHDSRFTIHAMAQNPVTTNESPAEQLQQKFAESRLVEQHTVDEILTLWMPLDKLKPALAFLKREMPHPYQLLYDVTAIDERTRKQHNGYIPTEFTLV